MNFKKISESYEKKQDEVFSDYALKEDNLIKKLTRHGINTVSTDNKDGLISACIERLDKYAKDNDELFELRKAKSQLKQPFLKIEIYYFDDEEDRQVLSSCYCTYENVNKVLSEKIKGVERFWTDSKGNVWPRPEIKFCNFEQPKD